VKIGRRASSIAAGAVVAVLGAGCSALPQGDHRWISNTKEGVYTRIPNDWRTYTVNPYELNTVRPTPLPRSPSRWTLIFDSAPESSKKANKTLKRDEEKKASIKRLNETFPTHLIGEMSVQPLPSDWETGNPDPSTREGLSIDRLRNMAFNELSPDDLEAIYTGLGQTPDVVKAFMAGDPNYEVITYKEIADKKTGLRGLHVRMNWQVEPFKWTTVDEQILLDRASRKMYRLVLKCEASCFKRNYREAKRIASNWTVKK
jgi:hypothetical protein